MTRVSRGVWPVMLTPFTPAGGVDYDGLDALTEWYIKCGVSGLFSVAASSEMYELSDDERLEVARRVVKQTDGRVPVFASGTFGGEISGQSAFVNRMSETGVDGAVVIVSQMATEEESASTWRERVEGLLVSTGDIRLGMYECPRPYHRVLTAAELSWCAKTERFDFIKETSATESTILPKIEVTRGTRLKFYDACAATLLLSLKAGADGFCGIAGNFFSDLYVWLCENFENDPETAEELHRFLSVAERVVGIGYPGSAKLFLQRAGIPIRSDCRVNNYAFSERDVRILGDLEGMVADWRARVESPLLGE